MAKPSRLSLLPLQVGRMALIKINEIKHRQRGTDRHGGLLQAKMKPGRILVSPRPLGHIRIPDLNFLVRWLAAIREGPLEQFIIPSAYPCSPLESRIINTKKPAADSIKAVWGPVRFEPLRRQLPFRSQSNFVQHASKMENPTHPLIRASQAGDRDCGLHPLPNRHRIAVEPQRLPSSASMKSKEVKTLSGTIPHRCLRSRRGTEASSRHPRFCIKAFQISSSSSSGFRPLL